MRTAIWSAAALLVFGLGCGQKEPPKVVDGAGSYYPLVDGARYRYVHSNGSWIETVTLAAVEGEEDTFEQTQMAPSMMGESGTSVLVRRDGEVLRVSEETVVAGMLDFSVTYDPGFLRFADAWVDEREGFDETRNYERTETQAGQAPKAPQPRAHVFTVEEVGETVTVPAGTFRNCVVIRRTRMYTTGGGGGRAGAGGPLDAGSAGAAADEDAGIVDGQGGSGGSAGSSGAGSGVEMQEDQQKLFWFAPGVGKVREETIDTGRTEELIDYDIPEQ